MRVPRLKSGLAGHVLADDLVVIVGAATHALIAGHLHPLLLPLIDGRRTIDQIASELAGRAHMADVLFGLSVLAEDGLLDQDSSAGAGTQAPVPVLVDHDVATMLLAGEYLDSAVDLHARRFAERHRRWFPVRPDADSPWIGPLIAPPRTACWECVTSRLRANQRWRDVIDVPPREVGSLGGIARSRIAAVLRELREEGRSAIDDAMLVWHPGGHTWVRHAIGRRSGCPTCAGVSRTHDASLSTRTGRAASICWRDGGWRTVAPSETFARLAPHVSPLTGIVAGIDESSGGDSSMVVCTTEYLFPVPMSAGDLLKTGGRRRSAGKGRTLEQARVSALGEAIERYSGVFRGDEPRRRARCVDLGEDAIHPNSLAGFSDAQFRDRDRWNARGHDRARVPMPFDSLAEIEWTPVTSLAHDRQRWLPTACCYYGYANGAGPVFATADSNGTAAGNTIEEAILQGLLEIIERDAAAIWWYNRLACPPARADDLPADADAIAERYARLGRTCVVLDLTTDIGVPVFAAVSRAIGDPRELVIGFGAHFDARIAAARALTEVDQWLPALATGTAADRVSADPGDAPYLLAHQEGVTRAARVEVPRTINEAIDRGIAQLAARGIEVCMLDQTRDDVGFPVVKVVAPGMRHFWPRFAPGRLYDVPVAQGRLVRARTERDLNPSHLLI